MRWASIACSCLSPLPCSSTAHTALALTAYVHVGTCSAHALMLLVMSVDSWTSAVCKSHEAHDLHRAVRIGMQVARASALYTPSFLLAMNVMCSSIMRYQCYPSHVIYSISCDTDWYTQVVLLSHLSLGRAPLVCDWLRDDPKLIQAKLLTWSMAHKMQKMCSCLQDTVV
eukprot:5706793-Amphidinium_carterae.4